MAVRMRKVLQTAGLVFECVTCFFRVSYDSMAHFSAFGDSTASLFICVRMRFGPCYNYNHYLAAFVLTGPDICYGARCCVSYQGYLSFDPFFSIVASLKAM